MPYITVMASPLYHQVSFEELILCTAEEPRMIASNETNTRTQFVQYLNPRFLSRYNIEGMIDDLEQFCTVHAALYEKRRPDLYDRFFIPKKSGGLREINAPLPELMTALRNLKTLFETKMGALYHTSAFAYIPGRCTIDSVKRHQQNKSNWFLKTDFSNFFGSTTPEFLLHMLTMIFPFSEIVKTYRGKQALVKALDLCFLNGGLPQGTPISPMLTNLMMIPIDQRLNGSLREFRPQRGGQGESEKYHCIYTRYADDILVSCRYKFNPDDVVEHINHTLAVFHAPFQIKDEKTRFGSRAGSNWNLGVMLNKDNEITIGHKNKERLRAMLNNYIKDKRAGITWPLHDVQVMRGRINYYSMVEPDYVSDVIAFNNRTYGVDVIKMMNQDMSV